MFQHSQSFKDTVAIVTGSTRGIGKAIAKKMGKAGISVVLSGRTRSDGTRVVDEIRTEGGSAIFQQTDVRNPEQVIELIDATIGKYDQLDILINNAGFETDTPPEEVDLETWHSIIETDLRAYWLTAKHAYPHLVASDRGVIVNVSSNHAFQTQPKKFPYNVVKAGINGMTRSMAVAWGVDGIRVNTVNPGWTMVERIEESVDQDDLEYLEKIHPVGRIGTPEDVANAVLFLASQMAGFITGTSLVIDGGRTAILQDDLYLRDLGIDANL